MIHVTCDWCGEELETRRAPAAGPQVRARKADVVLPGLGDFKAAVNVAVEITTPENMHICAPCTARAVAYGSEHLEGPMWPPVEEEAEGEESAT